MQPDKVGFCVGTVAVESAHFTYIHNLSYFFVVYLCVKSTRCIHIKKIVKSNLCVKSTERCTIEKIVKSNVCVKSTEWCTIEKIVKSKLWTLHTVCNLTRLAFVWVLMHYGTLMKGMI